MEMGQYLEIFIEETKEHLNNMNQCLLRLEKNPRDGAALNEIFRAAHTLKGMSATMGFNKMSGLTHEMEDVLQALRSGGLNSGSNLADLLFKCLDALESILNNIVETGDEGSGEYIHIIALLKDFAGRRIAAGEAEKDHDGGSSRETTGDICAGHPTAVLQINQYEQNVINKAIEAKMNAFQITVVLNKGCLLKSARAFIVFQTLERKSEIIKSVPAVEDIEDEKFDNEFTVVVLSREDEESFKKDLYAVSEVEEVIVVPLLTVYYTDKKDNFESPEYKKGLDGTETGKAESDDAEEAEDEFAKVESVAKKSKTGKTVRVDISRLDVLLNLVSELIIQKSRLDGLEGIEKTKDYVETLEYLERITTSLHDAVMKVRMVPVESVFNRFPRMIRDISRDIGKEIVLNMSGEETELDRTVIDEIGEPLIHLLRNAADHGIESAEKRKELGKPPAGQINLRAYQDGSSVVIEVEDDGQGIDIEKVKRKAIEKGLIDDDAAGSLSKKDVIDFLFLPSFSTAETVTGLSGRGVGLDVVKTKIESLGGNVEIETAYGKGSRFIIRLPLTLAIIQALLVRIGEEKYAIQISSVNQIIKVFPDEIKTVNKQEVILLRNEVIPIIRLEKALKVQKEEKLRKKLTIVIVRKGERLTGFVVDDVICQQEIVQKPLGKLLSGVKTVTSATILGDGSVALILDANSLAV